VEELRYADVRGVDVGSWFGPEHRDERLMTFESFLALVASKGGECFVEVKGGDVEMVPSVVACARGSVIDASSLTFIGFNVELMRRLKAAAPEFGCYGIVKILPTGWRWLDEMRALRFARRCLGAGLDGVDYRADAGVVTKRVVDAVHEKGLQCVVYANRAPAENDTPELWHAMKTAGVDAFMSNCSAEAFEWWASRCGEA